MDFDVAYSLENAQQFWDELDEIVSVHCETQILIDNALKAYLAFASSYADDYLHSEYDWAKCAYKLLDSSLFAKRGDRVRRRMLGRLRKEKVGSRLHLAALVLLYDGRGNQKTFKTMSEEGLFIRLMDLVQRTRGEDRLLWRAMIELLYEMSRIQRLRLQDLEAINDEFISYLFKLVEEDPEDPNDPYHYPIIRILLVLNEQYMVSAHAPSSDTDSPGTLTNKVIKILCFHGSTYKTFGENIILLLNRESETCLQLLILKLLYLLFTTSATYEYFYSNDLRVLVDVMIRNLLDLPDESEPLRHTYLRVLYPLLEHTQLRHPPYYKREELLKLLEILSGARSNHFQPVDQTTIRLVSRCADIPWLRPELAECQLQVENPTHKLLGISLGRHGQSSVTFMEVATKSEKPGVITPSRKHGAGKNNINGNGNSLEIAGEA